MLQSPQASGPGNPSVRLSKHGQCVELEIRELTVPRSAIKDVDREGACTKTIANLQIVTGQEVKFCIGSVSDFIDISLLGLVRTRTNKPMPLIRIRQEIPEPGETAKIVARDRHFLIRVQGIVQGVRDSELILETLSETEDSPAHTLSIKFTKEK